MGQRSTITRDPAIQKAVDKALASGKTIDEVVALLEAGGEDTVSRSAVGRYAKRYRPMIENTIRVRHALEALDPHMPEGDLSLLRLARHKLQAEMLRTLSASEDDPDAEPWSPKDLAALARSLSNEMTTELRAIVIRDKQLEDGLKAKARNAVTAARRAGATPEQLAAIRERIMGPRK